MIPKNGNVVVDREKCNKIGMIAFGGRIMNIKKLGPNSLELPYSEHTSLIIKSCLDVWYKTLLPEHQAQVINYLQATGIPIGLLVNFGNKRLEYKRLHHPSFYPVAEGDHANPVFCC